MATGRVPTTANSPLTAKGDLFGYSTTQARVPVGNDGETIVADSSTATGLRYTSNFAAGKNAIINGAFNVWQRGTTFTNPASATYTADRFFVAHDGTGATRTISRQAFTPGSAPVAGYEGNYFYRYAFTAVGTGNSFCTVAVQRIEDVTTFAGQTVTISFWAKNDTSKSFNVYYNQVFGSGGSGSTAGNGSVTIGTSWARYSVTLAIPSIAGKTIGTSSYLEIYIADVAGTRAAFTLDLWGLQVESNSVASAFQTATGTIQGELAACQRYYYRTGGQQYTFYGNAIAQNATSTYTSLPLPVTMRTTAASIDYQTAVNYRLQGSTAFNVTAISLSGVGDGLNTAGIVVTVASGLTAGNYYQFLSNNSTATYIGISAEL